MAIYVNQAFADAVWAWVEAAETSGGSSTAAWARVAFHGMQNMFLTTGEQMVAAQAVVDGEAVVFGGSVWGGAAGIGGAEAGFITVAGLGVGLAVCAGLIVVAGGIYILQKDKRKAAETTAQIYYTQYWPRFIRYAVQNYMRSGHIVEPLSLKEYPEYQNTRLGVPHFSSSPGPAAWEAARKKSQFRLDSNLG